MSQQQEPGVFHIGDVLSVTTGRLVSPSHIDGIYRILNFMTGDDLFTHELPRASRECEPHLREQLPELAKVSVPDGIDSEAKVHAFLESLYPEHGEFVSVKPLKPEDHTHIDPIAGLKMINPNAKIIEVSL
ncbi:MAG: DUF7736 domain-containing protein [Marmoricola sp.]